MPVAQIVDVVREKCRLVNMKRKARKLGVDPVLVRSYLEPMWRLSHRLFDSVDPKSFGNPD